MDADRQYAVASKLFDYLKSPSLQPLRGSAVHGSHLPIQNSASDGTAGCRIEFMSRPAKRTMKKATSGDPRPGRTAALVRNQWLRRC